MSKIPLKPSFTATAKVKSFEQYAAIYAESLRDPENFWLREARARGCAVSDGGGMAVGQAIGAFELFTGRAADAARVDAHFRRLVAGNI